MLAWRLLVSALLIPLLIAILWLDQQTGRFAWGLWLLCAAVAARSCWELIDLLKIRNMAPSYAWSCAGAVLVTTSGWTPHWFPGESQGLGIAGHAGTAFAIWVLVLLAVSAAEFKAPGTTLERLGAETFIVAYCGLLIALTAQLRWTAGGAQGSLALGSLIVTTKSGDIGAYAIGRLFGRRKMAPQLSPGKTWAGFAGAVGGAAAGHWAWLSFATFPLSGAESHVNPASTLAFGVVLGVVGLLGDLCESLIKRDAGRKDAAALFPGFGGLLDVLDSIVYAGPVAWLWWLAWPPVT